MARYKHIDTGPRLLAVDLERQLLAGSFAHAVHDLLDHDLISPALMPVTATMRWARRPIRPGCRSKSSCAPMPKVWSVAGGIARECTRFHRLARLHA